MEHASTIRIQGRVQKSSCEKKNQTKQHVASTLLVVTSNLDKYVYIVELFAPLNLFTCNTHNDV